MGYYTCYSLTVKDEKSDDIIWLFREEYENVKYALNEDGCFNGETKWYSHESDLKKFSQGFPDAIFTLTGEGEEAGDLWKLYVKNGKSYRAYAVISYEPFDESKLI